MDAVIADVYLPSRRVRVEFGTGNFNRLSDFLNSAPAGYLSGITLGMSDRSDFSANPLRRIALEAAILLPDVRFLKPIDEGPPKVDPGLVRERLGVKVELDVDEWRIAGTLHLADRVRWRDYLHSTRGRFVPLTDARAELIGSSGALESGLLLVNGSRVSALYSGAT